MSAVHTPRLLACPAESQVAPAAVPARWLNVHEYVGLDIMQKYGVPVPNHAVAGTVEEAVDVYQNKLKPAGKWRRS